MKCVFMMLKMCVLFIYYLPLKNSLFSMKHVRFKSHLRFFSSTNETKSNEVFNARTKKLSQLLNCSTGTARLIIKENKNILALTTVDFTRNVEFCCENLKLSDIIEFPVLITMNTSLLQHRYFSLKELGFSNITASCILKFPQLMKTSPDVMCRKGVMTLNDNHINYCLSLIPCAEDHRQVRVQLQRAFNDSITLSGIKSTLNTIFLSYKLEYPPYKCQKLLRIYPPLSVQSMLNTSLVLDVLLKKFGLSVAKMCCCPSILSLHHENVDNFLAQVPKILETDTVYIMNKIPSILKIPAETIKKSEKVLEEYNITKQQFLNCPKILSFTPNTIQRRLEYLCKSPDFSTLKPYKRFLWVAYYFNNLKDRVEVLKSTNMPYSINTFIVSKAKFEKYICLGHCRTPLSDVCYYLSGIFNCSEKEILVKLKEYPNYKAGSLSNCTQVITFLLNSGVTNQQLFNGLGIIFYDVGTVKNYFWDIRKYPECQPFSEWIHHYNFVQLLVYAIEADNGFRGDRVCKIEPSIEEPEQLSVSYTL